MIEDQVDKLNRLCRKYVTDEKNFSEDSEIRKVFLEIKNLGYKVFSDPFDVSSLDSDNLSSDG
jgi:hypothetical protein